MMVLAYVALAGFAGYFSWLFAKAPGWLSEVDHSSDWIY
jgi:hypothetical protein